MMNEQLQKALEEFLLKMIDGIEKAGQFTVEQVPDVIQQALTWFALKSGVGFAFGVIALITSILMIRWATKDFWIKDNDGLPKINYIGEREPKFERAVAVSAGAILTVVSIIIIVNNLEWIQILVAPKWFIVSEMSKLI